jgi:hypothetical protein
VSPRNGPERPHYWRDRLLTAVTFATVAVSLGVVAPAAMSKTPVEARNLCPTAGAMVVYYVSEGLSYKNDLVIGPDGRAALCWGRGWPTFAAGQTTFVLSRPTLEVLRATLERIDVEDLGPPPATWPPCCFRRLATLVYAGMGVPYLGQPRTTSARHALHRAQAILEQIIERHDPDL